MRKILTIVTGIRLRALFQPDLDCVFLSIDSRRASVKNKSLYLIAVPVVCLALIGATFAQQPQTNIDPARHPNLAQAQQHILEAFQKIEEAQQANKSRLGGHAEKAKQLLDQASRELKEAAEFANHRR
jgi:hypothetical protein